MAKRPTINTLTKTASPTYLTQLNQNFSNIQAQFDNTLSLDGSLPNAMNADLDLNDNDLINAGTVNADNLVVAGTNLNSVVAQAATSATNAAASASSSAASASTASQYTPAYFNNVAALLADTRAWPTGQILNTRAEGFSYQVAASGATDHHVITAGGVKLYVQPGSMGYNVKAFGAKGDGATTDTTAVQTAINTIKSTTGGAVYFPTGTYLCTVVVDGNQRVDLCGDGHGSILRSPTNNQFAVRYESNFRACQTRNILFSGSSKNTHGLYVNTGSAFSVESCGFTGCGMGLVFNATIDTRLVNAYFDLNYIALYYTCRTTAGNPTVTQVNGQSYTFSSAFFPQHPGESDIFGIFVNNNNIGVIIDQPDNPYPKNSSVKFWGGLIQSCVVGILGDLGEAGPPTSVTGTWFENPTSGSVSFNGTTYSAPNDIYINSGRLVVTDTGLQGVTLKNTSILKANNVGFFGVGTVVKDAAASFIGDKCEPNTVVVEGAKNYIRAPSIPLGSFTSVTRTTNPTGFTYRYSTKTRTSRKLVNADTVSFFGAGSSTNVVDGVLDVKECKEITLPTSNNGAIIFNNPAGSVTGKYYVGIIGIKLISGNPRISIFNVGAGAAFGSVQFNVSSDWRTYCFIKLGTATSTAGPYSVIGPTTPTTVVRVSGEYIVEFDTAEEVAEFLDANTFPLI